jgi:predicted ester cyclase
MDQLLRGRCPALPATPHGASTRQADIREDYLVSTWTPFPDFHFDVDRAFGEANWICVEGIFTGTHRGPLGGLNGEVIVPTHKSVRIPLCLVVKLEDGKAVEVHEYNDQLRFLTQLGLVSPPQPTG